MAHSKVIRRLLLVRVPKITAEYISDSPAGPFVTGDPLTVSPFAWDDELGLSHYGFLLEGMNLEQLRDIEAWVQRESHPTLLERSKPVDKKNNKEIPVEEVLNTVGLCINELA